MRSLTVRLKGGGGTINLRSFGGISNRNQGLSTGSMPIHHDNVSPAPSGRVAMPSTTEHWVGRNEPGAEWRKGSIDHPRNIDPNQMKIGKSDSDRSFNRSSIEGGGSFEGFRRNGGGNGFGHGGFSMGSACRGRC